MDRNHLYQQLKKQYCEDIYQDSHLFQVRSPLKDELEMHRQYLISENLIIGDLEYDNQWERYCFPFYITKKRWEKLQKDSPSLHDNILAFDQHYGEEYITKDD